MAELTLLIALVLAMGTGALFSCLVGPLLTRTQSWAPERRHRLLMLFSLSPMAVTLTVLFSALLPGMVALVWPALDHCLAHGDHHLHLCFVHLPEHMAGLSVLTFVTVALGWLCWRLGHAVLQLASAFQLVKQLRGSATWDASLEALVLDSAQPLCLLVGAIKPTVLISTGFMASITEAELDVALRHERAHAQRGDILLRMVVRVATVFLWSQPRRHLLRAIELEAERSCDEEAAVQTGSRLQVAAVILKVEQMLQRTIPRLEPAAASLGGDSVPLRIAALLEAPKPLRSVTPWVVFGAAVLVLIVGIHHPIHHLAEELVSALVH
jgi:Zn-dependent protease with chaperone function